MRRNTPQVKVLLFAAIALVLTQMTVAESKPLTTVSQVDLSRYVGKWYEIARYPNKFQKDCASDVTANYTAGSDGKIEVLNTCRTGDGKEKSSKGSAKVADKKTNAKLKVTFFWPFSGKYWIIALSPDYNWAVVGEPDRKYLWILSRTPQLGSEKYDKILDRVKELGYDPAKLVKTTQNSSSQ